MRKPDPKDKHPYPSMAQVEAKDAGAALLGLAKLGSMTFSVFFTKGAGDQYYRLAIITFVGMLAFVEYAPPLLVFIPIWLVFLIGKRKHRDWHSQSRGPSRLKIIFRNERLSLVMEPFVVFGIGLAFFPYSEPFAQFCMFGAVCMFVELAVRVHQIAEYRRKLRDAEAEMDYMHRIRRGTHGW